MRLAALLLLAAPAAAVAQEAPPATAHADPALRRQSAALIAILDGRGADDVYFSPAFRHAVPQDRLAALFEQLKQSLGRPERIESLAASSAWSAALVVGYARGTATMTIAIDPTPPHAVTGLRITGTGVRDDDIAKIEAAFAALPGAGGFGVYGLGEGRPVLVAGRNADAPAPLGSAFKLWVLAEAVRQVEAGERRWSDVVPIGPPSLASGIMQAWPPGTPVTLQTLATLMISISDNSATDTLMTTLGRDRVDAMAAAYGAQGPVPTTRELFVIKADAALTAAWTAASAGGRRSLLATTAARFAAAPLDPGIFAGRPVAVDGVEWFASPADIARLLDHLRGDPIARAILGVNGGIDPALAARFAYVGFKGGSEPGVLALAHLVRTKDGRWYAVVADWHRADDGVDELSFAGLTSRLLTLIAAR